MSIGQWIVYLAIALFCGLVGQALVGRSIGGLIVSTAVGLIGALLGSFLARQLHAPEPLRVSVGGHAIPLLWAVIGAALVVFVVSLVQRAARRT
jgi:uncharacterized membrane protein YeaQ/YmgE (transglycosylase-associated protein family)